eukprot:scaffold35342_cov112-Isochrysis_galbana.AAC.1
MPTNAPPSVMMRPLQMSFIIMTSTPRISRMLSFIDANVDSIVASTERVSPSGVRTCSRIMLLPPVRYELQEDGFAISLTTLRVGIHPC